MNDSIRRRYETLIRVGQFGTENAADFPAGSVGAAQFALIAAVVDGIEAAAAGQISGLGESARQFEIKMTARENLRDELTAIGRTARSMEKAFNGISDKYRFRRNLTDAAMLASARAFAADIGEHEADFIAYGLPPTFINDLTAAADAFEAAFTATAAARSEHITATAANPSQAETGMEAKRVLDGIIKNKYAGNPGKLAAWAAAAHVERPLKRRKPTTGAAPAAAANQ